MTTWAYDWHLKCRAVLWDWTLNLWNLMPFPGTKCQISWKVEHLAGAQECLGWGEGKHPTCCNCWSESFSPSEAWLGLSCWTCSGWKADLRASSLWVGRAETGPGLCWHFAPSLQFPVLHIGPCLSILQTFASANPNSQFFPPSPLWHYIHVLYVCEYVSVSQISSFVSYFRFHM